MTNTIARVDDADADDERAAQRDVAAELRDVEAVARQRRFPVSGGNGQAFTDRWFAGRDADDAAGDRASAREDRARAKRDRVRAVDADHGDGSSDVSSRQDLADQMVSTDIVASVGAPPTPTSGPTLPKPRPARA